MHEDSLHQKYCDLEWRCEVGGDGVDVEMVLSDEDVYDIDGDIGALYASRVCLTTTAHFLVDATTEAQGQPGLRAWRRSLAAWRR